MAESVKVIMGLKQAANYSKLAMHELGPRSYHKGQGALLKVVYRFGKEGKLGKDEAKKILGWRGGELRAVAQKAADNGYLTVDDVDVTYTMSLTPLGTEVIEKRLAAEDAAAAQVLAGLTEEERETLLTLTKKVSETCKGLGIDYDRIRKRPGKSCKRHHGHGRGPQNVFVFKGGYGEGPHGRPGHKGHKGHKGPKGDKGPREA